MAEGPGSPALTISVVIPTLNEDRRAPRLIEALWRQGVDEVIVCDGGSSDDTVAAVVGEGARVVFSRRGRGQQLRTGAAAASGQVLWFLHADVQVPEGAVASLRRALSRDEVVGGAFTLHTVDDGGQVWGPILRVADLRSRVTRYPYGDQGIFVRRAAYDAVGGFPELALMEDLAFSMALRAVGPTVTIGPSLVASGRRFGHRPLRAALSMWTFPTLWRLGVSPERLAAWYRDVR